jgi:nucleoside-diphosphate-sugar epimerase
VNKLLVTGALGVVGRAVVERISRAPDVQVVGVARRAPDAGLVEALRGARTRCNGCAATSAMPLRRARCSRRIAMRRTSSTPRCTRSRS